ncbi:MAG: hypothetical protein QXR97_01830 [Thermoproteota archaeon]
MKEIEFIKKEAKFVVKNYLDTSLSVIAVLIPFLLLLIINLQKDASLSLPGLREVLIEMNLASLTVPMAMFSAFLLAFTVNEEKKDKIFELIFTTPLSAHKFIIYHFIALALLVILTITIGYIVITLVMTFIIGSAYLLYVLILRGFVSSLLLALPICYLIILNLMLIPSKYSQLIIIPLMLFALLPMQGVFSIFGTSLGLFETITLSTFIASIVLTVISIAETVILKNRIVELTITNQ